MVDQTEMMSEFCLVETMVIQKEELKEEKKVGM
jgi:hypothetical protein